MALLWSLALPGGGAYLRDLWMNGGAHRARVVVPPASDFGWVLLFRYFGAVP